MLYFLDLFSSNNWLSEGLSGVMGAMEVGIRTLSFSLSTIIYGLIIKLYDIFELLCSGRLLSNGIMEELSTRIGLILGLVMFFYIIFSMIQMLLEPDKMNDKEIGAGNIIKKLIIVIVMLGFSNFAFNALYRVQQVVIESHALSNILLPYRIEQEGLDSFGKVLSSELLFSFYQLEDIDEGQLDTESKSTYEGCDIAIDSFSNQIINSAKFDLGYNCLNESVTVPENTGTDAGVVDREIFIVSYNYIIAPLVGCVAVYMLFMYCFKIGVRMIQLAFLEIISPMAFVSYLAPKKDTMFSKWIKIYISTYVDVFIRIVIINFVIFLLATIFSETTENGSFTFWDSIGAVGTESALFIKVIIVLALLTFAKKAPDLLKDLFGSGAPSKLGFGVAMKDMVQVPGVVSKALNTTVGFGAGTAIGLIGGAANRKGLGMITGGIGGALGGALRGAKAGFGAKGIGGALKAGQQAQAKANINTAQRRASGLGYASYLADSARGVVGISGSFDAVDKDFSLTSAVTDSTDNMPCVLKIKEMRQEALRNSEKMRADADIEHALRKKELQEQLKNRKINQLAYDREIAKADSVLKVKYDAATESVRKASENLINMQAATHFLGMGDTDSLTNMVQAGKLEYNATTGKYSINGIEVIKNGALKELVEQANKGNAENKECKTYADFDKRKTQLLNKKTTYTNRKRTK